MFTFLSLALAVQQAASPEPVRIEEIPLQYAEPLARVATFEVAPERSSYEIAEPFQLRFSVRNTSDGEVLCYCALRAFAVVYYRLSDGEFRQLRLREGTMPHSIPLYLLRPGEDVTETVLVSYDLGKGAPPFDRAGTYELRAVYFDRSDKERSKLESASVFVQVKPASDRAAYEAYSADLARLAHLGAYGGTVPEGTKDRALAFLREFGDSIYGPAVRRGLLERIYALIGSDVATDRDREIYEELQRERGARTPNGRR